ncbi:C1q-like domain-containing protein [Metabacillus arenae]|uniref:ABC transporter permease n=1 Tax=Metabacillus arenae TaxID=2771434 RepID=A0A926NL85_9BACI|nr:ABC transporter permease [Metabacillus arenae]MBD1383441.1 ABC transporter permease [Metabacillus arenae]
MGIRKECKCKSSAFRAVNTATSIPFPVANTFGRVLFSNEQFDLANEYNPATSTFVAKTAGIYFFTSAIIFRPNNLNVDYEVQLQFTVNGSAPDVEVDYTGFNAAIFNVVEVNDILRLNAGDRVEVIALSTTPGSILADSRVRFAGARFPSPTA